VKKDNQLTHIVQRVRPNYVLPTGVESNTSDKILPTTTVSAAYPRELAVASIDLDTATPNVGETAVAGSVTTASLKLSRHRVAYRTRNLKMLLARAVGMAKAIERLADEGDPSKMNVGCSRA
jgi:hypothetical protein